MKYQLWLMLSSIFTKFSKVSFETPVLIYIVQITEICNTKVFLTLCQELLSRNPGSAAVYFLLYTFLLFDYLLYGLYL